MTDGVEALADRAEITEVRQRFAWALDTRDWALLESLFTAEVDADLAAMGIPAGPIAARDLVAAFQHPFARSRQEMGTQQLYGPSLVELDGDTASARTYLLGHHHVAGLTGGEDVELRAAYLDRLRRTDSGWRICATSIQVFSIVGNPAIFA